MTKAMGALPTKKPDPHFTPREMEVLQLIAAAKVLMAKLSSWHIPKFTSQVLDRYFNAVIVIWCCFGRNAPKPGGW